MRTIDLCGEWDVRKIGAKKKFLGFVPGCVHTDLMKANEIGPPIRTEDFEANRWVCQTEWEYEKCFSCADISEFDSVVLRMEGVLGDAVVSLNDETLGSIGNPFEMVEFPIREKLVSGRNLLRLRFKTAEQFAAKNPECARRTETSYTGEIHPPSPTIGITRKVQILFFSKVRILSMSHTLSRTANASRFPLSVDVHTKSFQPNRSYILLVRCCHRGTILDEVRVPLTASSTSVQLNITNALEWWPTGMGEQPLYELTADVISEKTCHDHVSKRFGFCVCKITEPDLASTLHHNILCNGTPLFLKGGSWVALDIYPGHISRIHYARIIKSLAIANFNCLRVWAGIGYEREEFYDLCDEYGITVIQDFPLTKYHTRKPNAETLASFERELRANVLRISSHVCLIGWVIGESENIAPQYVKIIQRVVPELDHQHPIFQAHTHIPLSSADIPEFTKIPPSYPMPSEVCKYLSETERNSNSVQNRLHIFPTDGGKLIFSEYFSNFLLPSNFECCVWLSQIQEGVLMKEQLERLRVSKPNLNGFIGWHVNSPWASCNLSTMDNGGRWKACQYFARRFFSLLTCHPEYLQKEGIVRLVAFNDQSVPFAGTVRWRLTTLTGELVAEGNKTVELPPASHDMVSHIRVSNAIARYGAENLFLWFYLDDATGQQVLWNYQRLCTWRELKTQPPHLHVQIRCINENSFQVRLTPRAPAFWVWLSMVGMEAKFDDNFLCIEAGHTVLIRVTPETRIRMEQFKQSLRIGTLRDTCRNQALLLEEFPIRKQSQGHV